MKSFLVFLLLTMTTVALSAQDAPKTPPPAPHAHGGAMDMHQHMMNTQGQAAKMRATLEKMKANLSKITDPSLKQQAQYDVDLWEEMVQHMEGMSAMMNAHSGMGMGMDMKHHPAMPEDKPPTPEKK